MPPESRGVIRLSLIESLMPMPMKPSYIALAVAMALAACGNPDASRAQDGAFTEEGSFEQPSRTTPGDAGAVKTSFAPVVRAAAPAVVNIAARSLRQQRDPFWEFFGGGQPRSRVAESVGSGVIVRSDGVVVTNNHVIDGAQQITVILADRREFPARLVLADPRSDLAVLQIDAGGEALPAIAIDDQEQHMVGDLVLAIGNPFGVGQTVTNGIISALNRTETGISDSGSFIQTDAAINPGNSGGALVDMDGDLIGINTAIFSRSGSSSGVGFAIPATMVRRVVESAVGGAESVVRPWLGVRGDTVTAEIARSLGMTRPQGVLVSEIYDGGPGDRAGLQQGDVIIRIGGAEVNDRGGLNFNVGTRRPGDRVELGVLRNGRSLTLNATVQPPPETPAADETTFSAPPLQGATVVNLSPALADRLGIDPFAGRGVLVTGVSARGYAAAAGLRRGDLIREINGQGVNTVNELDRALRSGANWQVTIERGGRRLSARLSAPRQ
jgi:Do/DeqQ family serine protease